MSKLTPQFGFDKYLASLPLSTGKKLRFPGANPLNFYCAPGGSSSTVMTVVLYHAGKQDYVLEEMLFPIQIRLCWWCISCLHTSCFSTVPTRFHIRSRSLFRLSTKGEVTQDSPGHCTLSLVQGGDGHHQVLHEHIGLGLLFVVCVTIVTVTEMKDMISD